MRILVVGDTHGNGNYIFTKADFAKRQGCDRMLVVGDFGMWPGRGGIRFLDQCQYSADNFNVDIYALPGNHEDYNQWQWWLDSNMPKTDGFTHVRDRVLISPKIHNWKWDKKRFFIVGGAVSIDRKWRILNETYWEQEVLSDDEIASVEKYGGPDIDYLFTHDCSDFTPWGFDLVPDPSSKEHRQKIDRAIKALRPLRHWHGHMHRKYQWLNTASHGQRSTAWGYDDSEWNGKFTHTYGLDCNAELDSCGVLDTDKDDFAFESTLL